MDRPHARREMPQKIFVSKIELVLVFRFDLEIDIHGHLHKTQSAEKQKLMMRKEG
jgi:hypothetical protein